MVEEYILKFFYIVQLGLDFNSQELFLNLAFVSIFTMFIYWQDDFMIIKDNYA